MSSNNEWLGFNPQETEATESFRGKQEAIPNGRYQAIATTAVRKHTKSGNGWFWELTFAVALNTILELTPDQVAMIIGDREKITAANDGKLHFRDADEFRAWREARKATS